MALQKREKNLLIALAVVAVISGIFLYRTLNPDPAPVPEASTSSTTSSSSEEAPRSTRSAPRRGGGGGGAGPSSSGGPASVTAATFEQHNTINDCWVLIEGEVYNITSFADNLPGQQGEISQYCGTFGFEAGFLGENPQFTEEVIKSATKIGVIN